MLRRIARRSAVQGSAMQGRGAVQGCAVQGRGAVYGQLLGQPSLPLFWGLTCDTRFKTSQQK